MLAITVVPVFLHTVTSQSRPLFHESESTGQELELPEMPPDNILNTDVAQTRNGEL